MVKRRKKKGITKGASSGEPTLSDGLFLILVTVALCFFIIVGTGGIVLTYWRQGFQIVLPKWMFHTQFLLVIFFNLLGVVAAKQMRAHIGTDIRKFKKFATLALGFSFFPFLLGGVPYLIKYGYIDWLSNALPGKEQFGNNGALAVAFLLGAIVSGIVGNLAYDVLKWFVRKVSD